MVKKFLVSTITAVSLAIGVAGLTGSCLSFAVMPTTVYAESMEDLGSDESNDSNCNLSDGNISDDDKSVGNFISGQRGMTGEQLDTASRKVSPITNIAGYFVGGAIAILFAGVFVITALDLIYITIPPTRNALYKAGTDGTGAMTGGMPGGGGYGMRGGYGMQQQAQMMGGAAGGTAKPTQWISDEAVQCAALLGGSAQSTPIGGSLGMQQGQMPQNLPMKSVIKEYFKKRVFFMIFLAIAAIVLTSSVLLGTGVNLAEWLLKILDGVNNSIPK